MKPPGSGLLFVGRFFITVLISVFVMNLLRFSIYSWFSFGRLYFSKNSPISSKLSILLAYGMPLISSMLIKILEILKRRLFVD